MNRRFIKCEWPQGIEKVLNSIIIEMDIKKCYVIWLQILHVKKIFFKSDIDKHEPECGAIGRFIHSWELGVNW